MTDHPANRCNLFAHYLGKTVMRIYGWKVEGGVPDTNKMIVIAEPHTSNWDFIFLLGAAYHFRLSVHWLGKQTLFDTPALGPLLLYLGGVPVDRSRSTNMVQKLVDRIAESDGLTLVIPPSGTRAKTDYWRSGFYQIACGAGIPIVCGFLDYDRKIAGLGLSFVPSGNVREDMDRIRAFYEPINGKHPKKASRIFLKEETE